MIVCTRCGWLRPRRNLPLPLTRLAKELVMRQVLYSRTAEFRHQKPPSFDYTSDGGGL
jgi:hypothetical protein